MGCSGAEAHGVDNGRIAITQLHDLPAGGQRLWRGRPSNDGACLRIYKRLEKVMSDSAAKQRPGVAKLLDSHIRRDAKTAN